MDKLMSDEKEIVISKESLVAALPGGMAKKTRVTDELVDTVNDILQDPTTREHFRENILGYTGVLANGKYKLETYISAVKFVSYKMLGSSAVEAYAKTFPDRYQQLLNEGADSIYISKTASAFNRNKLVNEIYEQTLVPTHILNADVFQKAINVQAELMMTANSEKVRSDAANSLLTHLKRPEAQKVELSVSNQEDQSIKDLRDSTMKLVAQQEMMIKSGMMSAKEVAHSTIIEGEAEVID